MSSLIMALCGFNFCHQSFRREHGFRVILELLWAIDSKFVIWVHLSTEKEKAIFFRTLVAIGL